MNSAIIVAAGTGQRFGSTIPKQFIPVCGKPLLLHTLERFEACPAIDEVVLVLSEAGRSEFERLKFESSKLSSIVIGGSTRAESVRNGLTAVSSDCEVVAVHDGARPLVTLDEIARTVAKAAETGAACLVAEVTDTIKEVAGDRIIRTVDRRRLRRALTPQAFQISVLKAAFEQDLRSEEVTDDCYLIELLGNASSIAIVEGSSHNIKVTRPEDLVLAEAYLNEYV